MFRKLTLAISVILVSQAFKVWGENCLHLGISNTSSRVCRVTQKLDSLKVLDFFTSTSIDSEGYFPEYPDLVYEVKIASIDNLSPICFDYNQHVKRYIDIYTLERREQVSQMLGLAELYFPLFDEILDKHQLLGT